MGRVSKRGGAARRPGNSSSVLFVGHVVEPGDDVPVLVGFLHGDVCHEPFGGGAVPVFLAGLDVDHVAGPDLLYAAVAGGDEPDAVGDVERLAFGVVVPGGACAGRESNMGAADRGLFAGVTDAVDVDRAGEPVGRSNGGRAAALGELHRSIPSMDGAWAAGSRLAASEPSRRSFSADGEPGSAV